VKRAGAGEVVFDDSPENFLNTARRMLENPHSLRRYAANARVYAERTFDIGRITQQFLEVFAFAQQEPFAARAMAAAASAGGASRLSPR